MLSREWVRGPQWSSEQARAEWEPVLRRAQAAWSELEIASVPELREAALVHLEPDEVPIAGRDCSRAGLQLSVLARQADGRFRAAAHLPGAARPWYDAWGAGDDEAIGTMLGFPPCCRAFFARTWGAGSCDPTPAMVAVDGPWEANILLRWVGVRLVPHMPCAGVCALTVEQARLYLEHGRRIGLDMDAVEALLRLPVTYSALNGVAIVETPHFRFQAGADPGPEEVRRTRAAQGPDGFLTFAPGTMATLHGSKRIDPGPAPWEDNGFSSAEAMARAHAVVEEAVRATGFDGGTVLDLGCGDGTLLQTLCAAFPEAEGFGVEADEGRARRGAQRHPGLEVKVLRIENWGWAELQRWASLLPWDLVLLMPGRLLEMDEGSAANVRVALHERAARLVCYAYGDWLKDGGLRALAASAGIRCGVTFTGPGVEAGEGRIA